MQLNFLRLTPPAEGDQKNTIVMRSKVRTTMRMRIHQDDGEPITEIVSRGNGGVGQGMSSEARYSLLKVRGVGQGLRSERRTLIIPHEPLQFPLSLIQPRRSSLYMTIQII